MNKQQKARVRAWVKKLKSADYPKLKNEQRSDDGKRFCAVGMVIESYRRANGLKWYKEGSFRWVLNSRDLDMIGIPIGLIDWLGIDNYMLHAIAWMNDGVINHPKAWSYKRIAWYIENHVLTDGK